MSNFHIVTGKSIEDLNTNIEDFLKKNPKYTPYSNVYTDVPDCKRATKYQSFVNYGKSKSHKRRKSHKNESKKKHNQHKKHRKSKKHINKNK